MKKIVFTIFYSSCVTLAVAQSDQHEIIEGLIENEKIIEAEDAVLKIIDKSSIDYYILYGDILLKKGNYQKSLSQFETAQQNLEKDKTNIKKLAKCYSQLGYIHFALRNIEESLKFHRQALQIHKATNNKKGVAASHNDIGLTYSKLDTDKALEYYERALDAYQTLYGLNDERIATAHINIGYINREMNFQSDAFDHFEKALSIIENKYGKNHPRLAIIYSNISLIHLSLEEYVEATKYEEMALAIYKKAYGNKHPEIANTYNSIGRIYFAQELYLPALQQFQEAICANIPDYNNKSIYQITPFKDYYNPDALLFSIQLKGQSLEALHYDKTLKRKDLLAAWNNFITCDSLIDDIRRLKTNESDKIALGESASDIYEYGIRTSVGLAEVSWSKQIYEEKAFYFAEKSKSSVLLDAIADTNAKSYANIPDEVIANEESLKSDIAYYKQILAKQQDESSRNALFELEGNYQAFTKSLEKNYPQYYNLKYNVNIPSTSDVINNIEHNEAIISYFIAEKTNRIYTFYLSKKKFKIFNSAKIPDLDRYLSGYRNSIFYNVKNTYIKTASELHDVLIPPIENHVTSLTIIPAGRLGIIPFEALLTSNVDDESATYDQLPYLLKDYNINTQYAVALLSQKSTSDDEISASACIMAPVSFAEYRLPELPATASEAMKLNELFTNKGVSSKSYTYSDANEINIKSDEVANSRYLHFATHGIVDEVHPELSQIYLSSQSSSEDGNLYTGEIYNLKLNADLVTLSACQTGLGKIYKGEGIVGLSRALLYAGANNMLVSLWSVADQSTADLMVNFYNKALDNYSYSEGLQMAKKDMVKNKIHSAPYYWAPFILIGQ